MPLVIKNFVKPFQPLLLVTTLLPIDLAASQQPLQEPGEGRRLTQKALNLASSPSKRDSDSARAGQEEVTEPPPVKKAYDPCDDSWKENGK